MKQKSIPVFTTSQLFNSINMLKPHIEAEKDQLPPLTQTQSEASQVLSLDVIEDIDRIITGINKLLQSEKGVEAVREGLMAQIEKYDFLGNYHYAYLIN